MIAQAIGLRSIRFAPASRVARVLMKHAHDTWCLREDLRRVLAEARRENPAWYQEFIGVARRLNPELLREILPT